MRWPWITRTRYERELQQLKAAYEASSSDLQGRLSMLIERVIRIQSWPHHDETEISVRVRVPKPEFDRMVFSPLQREEYWWHIGKRIVDQLKREAMLGPATPKGE